MDFEDSKIMQAKTEHEILLEDPRNEKKRKRADKRRRRKYKFTDKHHTKRGIASTILAVFAIALVVIAIVFATQAKGQGGYMVGLMPFISILLSTAGIILSVTTFRKPDTIFTFAWTGLVSNIVIWLFVAVVIVVGI